jgi:hypothetical protein
LMAASTVKLLCRSFSYNAQGRQKRWWFVIVILCSDSSTDSNVVICPIQCVGKQVGRRWNKRLSKSRQVYATLRNLK